MTSQFLAPALRDGDEEVEQSLRPRRLDDFIGQERVKEQLEIAKLEGCDEGQGWLFAKAMPDRDIPAYLAERKRVAAAA